MSEERDKLRKKLFAQKKFKEEIVELFDGVEVAVRQPNVGQILQAQSKEDTKSALVDIMVEYCYIPGTNEKMFEPGDSAAIMEWPVGDWLTKLNEAVTRLTNIDVESTAKNSRSEG